MINDRLLNIQSKIESNKHLVGTEEATKNAFVMPFIAALGYDVFNPLEVVPEFTADIGMKKGEKVDYCIIDDGKPTIIIECKHWKENLDKHTSQLYRYFNTVNARFGILTNGIEYRIYTDLDDKNKMDIEPFIKFSMLKINDIITNEINKFSKDIFHANNIYDNAGKLKYTRLLKECFKSEFTDPDDGITKVFARKVSSKIMTSKVVGEFKDIIKVSYKEYLAEEFINLASKGPTESVEVMESKSNINTTEDELMAYRIVQSMLVGEIDLDRITYKDRTRNFTILLDDNRLKCICKLYLEKSKRYVEYHIGGQNIKFEITKLTDLFEHKEDLIIILKSFIKNDK